jgi:DHA2 family multidrug resistance protein
MSAAAPVSAGRLRIVTAALMTATTMISLDTTIANVALPRIQGSISASTDQITWVLTSYIVAAAIATPLAGWLTERFGRKRLIQTSIFAFTAASALCGLATTLEELVLFRVLQGAVGAAIVPVSQAVLLDLFPKERQGQAMAIWGMGAVVGPIFGPALGGYLTEQLSWHWVFFINVPVGVLAFIGLNLLEERKSEEKVRLDMYGFALLALAIGALQLMLDRGHQLDWFDSWEIRVEAGLSALFFYMFVAHIITARDPFLNLALVTNRNFMFGTLFSMTLGLLLFSTLAMLPPMLENLLHYPVLLTGLVTMPRGIGIFVSMSMANLLLRFMDPRALIALGLALNASALYIMSGYTLEMDTRPVITSGIIQGLGIGLFFVPTTILTFATLEPHLRAEGTALFTLVRSLGGSIGISILSALTVRNSAIVHSRLIEGVRPDNPVVQFAMPGLDFGDPASLAAIEAQIRAQASMVSYNDAFWLLTLCTLGAMPLVLLLRKPAGAADAPHVELA